MIADNYLQLRTELETALAELLKLSSEMRRDPAHARHAPGLAHGYSRAAAFRRRRRSESGQILAAQRALRPGICQSGCAAGDRPGLHFPLRRGGKIGRGFAPIDRALSADPVPARLQCRRHAGHEHDGGRAPDDHREFCPARRSRSLCFFRGESLVPIRLGAAEFRAKKMAQERRLRSAAGRPAGAVRDRNHPSPSAGHGHAKARLSRRRSFRSPRAKPCLRARPASTRNSSGRRASSARWRSRSIAS